MERVEDVERWNVEFMTAYEIYTEREGKEEGGEGMKSILIEEEEEEEIVSSTEVLKMRMKKQYREMIVTQKKLLGTRNELSKRDRKSVV